MPQRSRIIRSNVRRSGDGVSSFNNLVGAVSLESPMATQSGQAIFIDNGNEAPLTDGAVVSTPNTRANNAFTLTVAGNNHTVPAPATVPPGTRVNGQKITFAIRQGGAGPFNLLWVGGAGGYAFANSAGIGPTQNDFDGLMAIAPANSVVMVGWQYHAGLNKWCCVAVAGYYT